MLDYAHFAETIVIDVAAASLSCVATTFQQTATFRVRYAEIVLDRALFAKPATLAYAEAGFGRSIGLHMPTFDESILRDIGRRPQPRLLSVRQVDVSNLVLASIDLTACLLWGAHHLDQLRIEGPNPFPFTPRGWHLGRVWGQGLPIWRWTRRQTVAEEHIWQAQRRLPSSLAGRPHPKFMGWNPPPARLLRMVEHSTGQAVRRLEPDRLALLYRRLRKGREDSKNEPGAADFYYGEMEMRRRAIETPWVERVILSVYWLVSGYGLRGLRALLTLLVVVAGVAVLFQHIGLYQPVRPHSYLAAVLYAAESMLSLASGGVQLGVSVRTLSGAAAIAGGAVIAISASDREAVDDLVIGGLGVGEGEAGVDLEGLAVPVAGVGLDERVVDALGLEPGEQEVSQGVGADRGGDAGGLGVARQELADAAVAVRLLPRRLEQESGVSLVLAGDVQGEGFLERGGEGHDAVLAALAVGDPHAAGVQVDIDHTDA